MSIDGSSTFRVKNSRERGEERRGEDALPRRIAGEMGSNRIESRGWGRRMAGSVRDGGEYSSWDGAK